MRARILKLLFVTFVFAICTGAGFLLADRRVEQPFPFAHAPHTAKADCTLCHRGARAGRQAGLPDMEICTRCHATAPKAGDHEEVWAEALKGEAPPWQRLYRLPSHVFFSHRRHTTVGKLECATCHGDMEHRTSPPTHALKKLWMADCIGCHEQKDVTVDCIACHR